jgi:hypothetical protein
MCNHPAALVISCLIDPSQPVRIATGIQPTASLALPRWVVSRTLARLRLLFRGGPMLIRGDLADEDNWARPLNETERFAPGIVPLTEAAPAPTRGAGADAKKPAVGGWGWLQPLLDDRCVDDVPVYVPYNLVSGGGTNAAAAAAEYPLQMGPHTCLEGFYKLGLLDMEAGQGNLLPEKPVFGIVEGGTRVGGDVVEQGKREEGTPHAPGAMPGLTSGDGRRATPASAKYRMRGLAG